MQKSPYIERFIKKYKKHRNKSINNSCKKVIYKVQKCSKQRITHKNLRSKQDNNKNYTFKLGIYKIFFFYENQKLCIYVYVVYVMFKCS